MTILTTSFVGADNSPLVSEAGWTTLGGSDNVLFLDGAGNVKDSGAGFQRSVGHDTGSQTHYLRAIVGAGFIASNSGIALSIGSTPSGGWWGFSYNTVNNVMRSRGSSGSDVDVAGAALAAGDEVEISWNYTTGVRVLKINGVTKATDTWTGSPFTGTHVGIIVIDNRGTARGDVLRSWQSDSGTPPAGGDTTIPTLTGVITEVGKTENSISISWPAGADNIAVTSYEVSTNGGSTWTDTGNTTTSRTFTGLTASTAYDIRVRAKDGAGNVSTPALATSITTLAPDTTVPVLTGAITVGAKSSGTIALSWPTGTDNVGVTAYDVRVNGGAWTPQGTSTSTIVTGLSQLTSYTLEVTARDAAGNRSTPPLSVTTSTYRNGATGQFILDNTGPISGNPAGILYNDVGVGDEDNWFSFVITTPPATGTLDINPDGTFTFTGPSAATMYYQLEVDGANVGSPQLVDLYETSGGGGDVTDPVLSLPTGLATSSVTATGTVTTDEGAGVLYKIITTSPTALEAAVAAGSSQSVVAVGLQSVSFAGLTPETTYYIHYLQEDPSGNRSLVVSSAGFTTPAVVVFNGAQDALNSIMVGKLRSLGFTGSLNDMLFAFYGGTGTLQDRERVWLIARTAVTGVSNKTMWAVYLRGLGYTGAFPDMLKAFWINY